MDAKIVKVEFKQVDYTSIAGKYGLDIKIVLPTTIATIEIVGWPGILISAFRYSLLKLIKTPRITVDLFDVDTNDKSFLVERFISSMNSIYLHDSCPKVNFNIDVINKTSKYMYVSTKSIKYTNNTSNSIDSNNKIITAEFANDFNIAALKSGKYLRVKGSIIEGSAIETNSVFHNGINNFSRTLHESKDDIIALNSGKIEFMYSNGLTAKKMIKSACDVLCEILLSLENSLNIDVGKYSLLINYDRSCIIANLIYTYLEIHYNAQNITYLKCDYKQYNDFSSLLLFNDVPNLQENLNTVLKSLAKLITKIST
jgi:hypothetical protein